MSDTATPDISEYIRKQNEQFLFPRIHRINSWIQAFLEHLNRIMPSGLFLSRAVLPKQEYGRHQGEATGLELFVVATDETTSNIPPEIDNWFWFVLGEIRNRQAIILHHSVGFGADSSAEVTIDGKHAFPKKTHPLTLHVKVRVPDEVWKDELQK